MCDIEEDSDIGFTPPEIREAAKIVTLDLLPEKSKIKYLKQYKIFCNWCEEQNIKSFSENVLLVYFKKKSESMKSTSLWPIYSMLKATINLNNNVNISSYTKLIAFLKKQSVGCRSKKSRVLTRDDVNNFLTDAPNEKYLLIKVCLISKLNDYILIWIV